MPVETDDSIERTDMSQGELKHSHSHLHAIKSSQVNDDDDDDDDDEPVVRQWKYFWQ